MSQNLRKQLDLQVHIKHLNQYEEKQRTRKEEVVGNQFWEKVSLNNELDDLYR